MLLAHIADVHAGKRLHGYDMTKDLAHVLDQVARTCVERGADALLVAGDLYDSGAPSAAAVSLVGSFLSKMAAASIPVIAVPGNHDSAERVGYAAEALGAAGIHMAGRYDGDVRPVTLADEHGPVDVWPLPFVRPADVRAALGADVSSYTEAFAAVVDALPVDKNRRNVAVAHQFVTASGKGPERSESEVSVGGIDNVDASAFDPFDYAALGHIHRAAFVGRPEVRYAGAPLAYSKGEANRPKTLALARLGAPGDPVALEEVPLEPLHAVRRVRGPLAEVTAPEALAQAPVDDYVYAELTDEEVQLDDQARLADAFPNLLGYEYRARAERQAGSEPPALEDLEEASPLELFGEFFAWQGGGELTDAQRALVADALEKAGVAR